MATARVTVRIWVIATTKSNGSTDKSTSHVMSASSLQTRSGMRQLPVNKMKPIYPESDIQSETIEQTMHH